MSSEQLLSQWTTLKSLITKQQQELQALKIQLAQERNWWDKWIADDKQSWHRNQNLASFVYSKTGKCFTFRIGSSDLMLDYGTTNDIPLAEAKRMIKAIADYYKNQPN
ncbi:MAG: hypothetical protein GBAus27B_000268 [Mycoplasmataceae bacterium]|nr:MAG: hypothetical protein GBAus27B_000268 [Mycoplasmataceae bacterium]